MKDQDLTLDGGSATPPTADVPTKDRMIEVRFEDLQHLFDLATNSLDFGSGFWDSDDVVVGRRLAEALGVDPMTATPREFKSQWAHPFSTDRWGRCLHCNAGAESAVHEPVTT